MKPKIKGLPKYRPGVEKKRLTHFCDTKKKLDFLI
jgi:hypothetical protein